MYNKNEIMNLLLSKTWLQITEQYVLPEILKKGGSARNYVISDDYMLFMSDYAALICDSDFKTGSVLLEIGMQRLSCGAVKHLAATTVLALPQRYVFYSTFFDKPALLSDACFAFLQNCLPLCFKKESLQKHAQQILFGLICNLDSKTGAELNGYVLANPTLTFSNKQVFDWAWQTGLECMDFEAFWTELARDNWCKYKDFFVQNWDKIDIRKFHGEILYRQPAQLAWPALAEDSWQRHIGFFHDHWMAVDKERFYNIINKHGLFNKAKVSYKIKHYKEKKKKPE